MVHVVGSVLRSSPGAMPRIRPRGHRWRSSIDGVDALISTGTDPWRLELIAVRDGSYGGGERRSLTRDVERGLLLLRVRQGVHVERTAFELLSPEDQHIVRMRAFAAASPEPVVFSHWSAAVLHGLPVLRRRLAKVHTTVRRAGARGEQGVSGHLFALTDDEVVPFGPLLATGVGRTVVDVAGASPFEEGVMAADAALHDGVPRDLLAEAADLVGPRQALRRITDVIRFADPGAESAAESVSRATMMRIGIAPPLLQHRLTLRDGSEAALDFAFPWVRAAGEVDGERKLLDPAIAPDARRALVEEKAREDEVRTMVTGLARWGWIQAGDVIALSVVLHRIRVDPAAPRASMSDYWKRAAEGRARFVPRRPRWRR